MGHTLAHGIALAMLDGEWTLPPMRMRAQQALACKPRWLSGLIRRVLAEFPAPPGEVDTVTDFINADESFHFDTGAGKPILRIHRWFLPTQTMLPVLGTPASFAVPAIATVGSLAEMLTLSGGELDWFADAKQLNNIASDARLRHYCYRWVDKRSTGHRLLETPKSRIKATQREILRRILAHIPASPHAHGFVPKRSVGSFVAPHIGKRVVVRLDLQDFFAAIGCARVVAIFNRVGYPRHVARVLAALCTTATPQDVLNQHPGIAPNTTHRFTTLNRLRIAHLPQGAPTSPALSNLAALAMDRRLNGLADAMNATYTRYADDLVFSGGPALSRNATRLIHIVGAIAIEEGFDVNFRKTRVMRAGRRQQIAGVVVNQRANVKRSDYDALRATLHNAAKTSAAAQNRHNHPNFRAHLQGRISWVAATNAARGVCLQRLFDAIDWSTA